MIKSIRILWPAAILSVMIGCGDPNLTSMKPKQGIPHTLVDVDGDVLFARVLWNTASATPDTLRGHWLGAGWFSVPHNTPVGNYDVRLYRGALSPETETFTVIGPGANPFPNPKLTYLQSLRVKSVGADSVDFWLFAQGPNVDVSADIIINGTTKQTAMWAAAQNDFAGIDSTTYGYPVFHYTMVFTQVRAKVGANLTIAIANNGGATTNTMPFTVADSLNWDSDSDGLLDLWEKDGYDHNSDGTVDCDLPGMGADPFIFDIFVEVDFMNDNGAGGPIHRPTGNPWLIAEDAFRNAPLLNISGGMQGIQLHIDRGNSDFVNLKGEAIAIPAAERKGGTILPYFTFIREDDVASPCGAGTSVNFYDLKFNNSVLAPATVNFDSAARQPIFHYNIFADEHGHSCNSTGRGEIGGNDFWVSDFDTPGELANDNRIAGTFMHEFGHNLGQLHGGLVNESTKPNYNSIMCYSYQLDGVDTNCDNTADGSFNYSYGMLTSLNENNLDENKGLCNNNSIDWNSNGAISNGVSTDISGNGANSVIDDFDNWGNLKMRFREDPDFND